MGSGLLHPGWATSACGSVNSPTAPNSCPGPVCDRRPIRKAALGLHDLQELGQARSGQAFVRTFSSMCRVSDRRCKSSTDRGAPWSRGAAAQHDNTVRDLLRGRHPGRMRQEEACRATEWLEVKGERRLGRAAAEWWHLLCCSSQGNPYWSRLRAKGAALLPLLLLQIADPSIFAKVSIEMEAPSAGRRSITQL